VAQVSQLDFGNPQHVGRTQGRPRLEGPL